MQSGGRVMYSEKVSKSEMAYLLRSFSEITFFSS